MFYVRVSEKSLDDFKLALKVEMTILDRRDHFYTDDNSGIGHAGGFGPYCVGCVATIIESRVRWGGYCLQSSTFEATGKFSMLILDEDPAFSHLCFSVVS